MATSPLKSLVDTTNRDYPSTLKFCMCCSAAFLSETITYPLDILKTRIQVYGELQNSSYPGVIKICSSVIRNEGLFKLWQGLSPALFRHIIYTGARMPIYEIIRQDIFHLPPASHFTVKSTKNSFSDKSHVMPKQKLSAMEKTNTELIYENNSKFVIQAAFTGVIAGSFAQFLASPIDLIKVRLQTERRWMSEQHLNNYKPSKPTELPTGHQRLSFTRTAKQIISEGGIIGLWRGGLPSVQRAALVNMGELTTYDTSKRWFAVRFQLEDGTLLHVCASITSGFVAAVLGTPADMIKTRMMNQRTTASSSINGSGLLYAGVIDCFRKTVKNEGFSALYKGFFLIWARMAPWSLTFWVTYEKIRCLAGVDGF
ncbi:hypothetical protein MS3_00002476 [Schistosoma haematobium]|uniref:Mitochondrial uncoupling protein 4 n=4 Tax=Schistosoma haematobium TaxID=6185 RepID=A0A922S7S3_SCHHA|nr:hypothetical protein MS3_00002476 [Schistosoma haematobium]KAH9596990.1 hypothetical protein MS3_00002476 [Schistosoma haematobium]CAH8492776.1 unnamed protein product [Schistosoma haematobium]